MEKQCFTIVFETDHEPANGKFRNVILQDSANNILYIYDSCGAYTTATSSFIEGNAQMLHWNPTTRQLTISDGNTVNIPSDNTDNQTLEYNKNTNELSIERGNTVTLQTVDPRVLPWEGDFILDGGVFNPGVGLQGNVTPVTYADGGRIKETGNIPTVVFEPTKDTYLVLNKQTGTVDTISIGYADAPPLLPDGHMWLGWVRTSAASITNHQDIRLLKRRGISAKFTATEPTPARYNVPTTMLFNRTEYRYGDPFRTSETGVFRVPKSGSYLIHSVVHVGTFSGIYRAILRVLVNGGSTPLIFGNSISGRRDAAGNAAGTNQPIRVVGSGVYQLNEGDLVEVQVQHQIGTGGTRNMPDGYVTIDLLRG